MAIDWPSNLNDPAVILQVPGYAPDVQLTYRDEDESLEVVIYMRAGEPSIEEAAASRLDDMRAAVEEELEVLTNGATDDGGYQVVVRLPQGRRRFADMGIYWVDLDTDQRLELNYACGPDSAGQVEDLTRMIASLAASDAASQPVTDGWARRYIGRGVIHIPANLTRISAFSIRNAAQSTRWMLDAIPIDPAAGELPRTIGIPDDEDSAMMQLDAQVGLAVGTKTLWSVVDPEMGEMSERVVRADLVIDSTRVVLRGSGPPEAMPQLETELNVMIEQLSAQ